MQVYITKRHRLDGVKYVVRYRKQGGRADPIIHLGTHPTLAEAEDAPRLLALAPRLTLRCYSQP